MKKLILFSGILLFVLIPYQTLAGDDETDVSDLPVRERIYVGGYVGLQFGTITAIIVSPTVAYRFTNRLTSGLGATYQYYRDSGFSGLTNGQQTTIITSIYGGNLFARYTITPQIFVQTEFEALNLDSKIGSPLDTREGRYWEFNYFAGGGYRAALSPRTFLNIIVLWNFNSDSQIHNQNPVIRLGVDVRL